MEGGSVEFNGTGTILTSTSCLLNPNRNKHLNRDQIENYLFDYYGANQVLWVEEGIVGDDTDGHIDDTIRFVNEDTVLTVFESNKNDENYSILHTTESASTWNGHFGSRISFGPDGKLYWATGEGGGGSLGGATSPHQNGQRLNTMWGKIHRMNLDGTVPADNPLLPGQTTRSTIFSYGHRNPQGMAFDPISKQLFENEHGPSGGCELNRVQASENFGWPLYSMGINYNGTTISSGHIATGIVAPLKSWTPAFAPSGLTFINHPSFRDWNGNLLMGSLVRRHLLMIKMTNGVPSNETILLDNNGRIRNVKMGPGGKIYVSVEDGGRLLVLTAK